MAKLCKYSCGTTLEWNVSGNFFANPDGSRHDCRNQAKPKAELHTDGTYRPPSPKETPKRLDNYYSGIKKLAELDLVNSNAQLQDARWELLKIVEKQVPEMATEIIYVLGLRE